MQEKDWIIYSIIKEIPGKEYWNTDSKCYSFDDEEIKNRYYKRRIWTIISEKSGMNMFIFIAVYLLIDGVLSVTEIMDSCYFEDDSISVLEKIFSLHNYNIMASDYIV